ncbi:MAG: hypothetical protein K9L30_19070 [Desulfobacterales bacterium]|nr:hypothetical protein [Desulfobacterales bacterium]
MADRICDACGKRKKLEGGKTCDKGHFICYSCRDGGSLFGARTKCLLCKTKLK